jgi:diguanylate cyclase (GGDEF)-like protein
LEQMADVLREWAREIDRVGRYGGEEFMVVLPETSVDDAEVFVERVRREVARRPFNIGGDDPLHMTISAGIATFPHERVKNPETLVRLADEALYTAKTSGRNRVVRFDQAVDRAESATETAAPAATAPAPSAA